MGAGRIGGGVAGWHRSRVDDGPAPAPARRGSTGGRVREEGDGVGVRIGYKASAEQFAPRELVEYAVR
ncbi:MAG TPA: hypothetical protein VEZ42_11455, partial [Pseudonocardia sp.]|nr:hypothetical protein [Pseudonocardia sp.]